MLDLLRADGARTYESYAWMLNEDEAGARVDASRDGLARELARINLTLATYTQWYWKTDLHNLMNFLRLRADAHAQYEIRVYAEALVDVMARWGAAVARGLPRAPAGFGDAVPLGAGRGAAAGGGGDGYGGDERAWRARVARGGGGVGAAVGLAPGLFRFARDDGREKVCLRLIPPRPCPTRAA